MTRNSCCGWPMRPSTRTTPPCSECALVRPRCTAGYRSANATGTTWPRPGAARTPATSRCSWMLAPCARSGHGTRLSADLGEDGFVVPVEDASGFPPAGVVRIGGGGSRTGPTAVARWSSIAAGGPGLRVATIDNPLANLPPNAVLDPPLPLPPPARIRATRYGQVRLGVVTGHGCPGPDAAHAAPVASRDWTTSAAPPSRYGGYRSSSRAPSRPWGRGPRYPPARRAARSTRSPSTSLSHSLRAAAGSSPAVPLEDPGRPSSSTTRPRSRRSGVAPTGPGRARGGFRRKASSASTTSSCSTAAWTRSAACSPTAVRGLEGSSRRVNSFFRAGVPRLDALGPRRRVPASGRPRERPAGLRAAHDGPRPLEWVSFRRVLDPALVPLVHLPATDSLEGGFYDRRRLETGADAFVGQPTPLQGADANPDDLQSALERGNGSLGLTPALVVAASPGGTRRTVKEW